MIDKKKSQTDLEFFRLISHPRIFGKHVVGRLPYSLQELALLCPHPRRYDSCGRAVGKSTVLIQDNRLRRAMTVPYMRQIDLGTDLPVPYLCLLVGSTKEQASELTLGMRQLLAGNEVLASQINVLETMKTQIVFLNGARIVIRPATAGARGLHPPSMLFRGRAIKGTMDIALDEFAFFNYDRFLAEVAMPMMNMADRDSSMISLDSTPYGQVGEAYEITQQAGKCLQKITIDPVTKYPQVSFDRSLCKLCMARNRWVLFQFPTYFNPHVDREELVARKLELMKLDRMDVFRQEVEGVATSTSNLFLREPDMLRMFSEDAELVEWYVHEEHGVIYERTQDTRTTSLTYGEVFDTPIEPRKVKRGRYYIGIDPNHGTGSDGSDYAAIAMVEVVGDKVYLRLCQRFKQAPKRFLCADGLEREYTSRSGDLTMFLIDLATVLMDGFGARMIMVDQGGGGPAILSPLQKRYNEELVQHVPTSQQAKNEALTFWRGLIHRERFKSPALKVLQEESKFLLVDQDSYEKHDKMSIQKAKRYGTKGAEVDAIFAVAYACYPLRVREARVSISAGEIRTAETPAVLQTLRSAVKFKGGSLARLMQLRRKG